MITIADNRSGRTALAFAARTAFIVAAVIVIVGSLMPSQHAPSDVAISDKTLHFCGYLTLGLMGGLGWPERWRLFAVVAPLLGLALEFAQMAVPGRSFEWGDAMANALGALAGVALAILYARKNVTS